MFIFLYVGSIFSKFLFRQLSEFSSVNWWLISSYIPRKNRLVLLVIDDYVGNRVLK